MVLVLIILHSTHTTVSSSLSLRELSEITILPETPQHRNCEFSLGSHLLKVLQPQPRPHWGLPPFEISLPMRKRETSYLPGQGTVVLESTGKLEGCMLSASTQGQACPGLQVWALSTPYFLIQEISAFVEICILPIHVCNMPRDLNVSSSSLIPFLLHLVYDKSFWPCWHFWIHRIYLPTVLRLPQTPRCDPWLYTTPSSRANLPGHALLKNGHSGAHPSLNSKPCLYYPEISALSNSMPLLLKAPWQLSGFK